ncbi:MAG: RloB domain-containing protein [Ignavibacteriaceae bacterium]|nr:RloB domain-containing protein [Ignavibacteriaceae bacterium]
MRRVGKYILILPEGWCEYNYAMALKKSLPRDKQRSISVEMPSPGAKNTVKHLMQKAVRLKAKAKQDKNPYDAVWLFFDNDNQSGLKDVFRKLKLLEIRIAYCSISIEHWFILHLEDIRTPFANSDEALRKIKMLWRSHFNSDYHKTTIKHFDKLKEDLDTAAKRAEQIWKQAEKDGIPIEERNPYFTIPDLISYFTSL